MLYSCFPRILFLLLAFALSHLQEILKNVTTSKFATATLKVGLPTKQILQDDILFNLIYYMYEEFNLVTNSHAYKTKIYFPS